MVLESYSENTQLANSAAEGKRTNSYYRLSINDHLLVSNLRSRVKDELTKRYDTDFNLYRWIRLTERSTHKVDLDLAEKLLRNHLRYRKAMELDSDSIPSWDDNPLHQQALMPRGYLDYMPSNNRYLLWIDYPELMDGVVKAISNWDLAVWNFWLYEDGLRLVNEREKATGAMSGIHLVINVKNLSLTPRFMFLAKSGYMTYAANLIHYEHFPELVYPTSFINTSKLLTIPYRICQRFMPHDFSDRYRVHGSNYKSALLREMREEELPTQLGGKNPRSASLAPVPPNKSKLVPHKGIQTDEHLLHIQIPAGKRKLVSAYCNAGSNLNWWFQADAEVSFGVYFAPAESDEQIQWNQPDELKNVEMVAPVFLIVARVPEMGSLKCQKTGTYYLLFCSKRSWFYGRKIQLKVEVDGKVCKELEELNLF